MFHHTLYDINSYMYMYLLFSALSGKQNKTKPQTNKQPPRNKTNKQKPSNLSQLFYYLENNKIANPIFTEEALGYLREGMLWV